MKQFLAIARAIASIIVFFHSTIPAVSAAVFLQETPPAVGQTTVVLASKIPGGGLAVSIELKKLLEMPLSELDLETLLLEELGCYYDPSSDDLTVREWLESVQKSLNRSS